MQKQVTIRNQREAFLYTVRVVSEQGWCEARNLSHKVAKLYAAASVNGPAHPVSTIATPEGEPT